MDYRVQQVFREEGIAGNDAAEHIHLKERSFLQWTHYLEEMEGWSPSNCEAVVAADHMETPLVIEKIAQAIGERDVDAAPGNKTVEDFALASKVSALMAKEGYPVAVSVHGAEVDLTIVKHVLMLSRHKKKLIGLASALPEVKSVSTRIGAHFHRANIICRQEYTLHPKSFFQSIEKQYTEINRRISGYRTPLIERRQGIRLSSQA
jgi:hypothetical protein